MTPTPEWAAEPGAPARVLRFRTLRIAVCSLAAFGALATWVVIVLTPGVAERWVDRLLYASPGSISFEIARGVSFVGSSRSVVLASMLLSVLVWRLSHRGSVAFCCLAVPALAGAGELVMKQLVGRGRPATSEMTGASGFGFPSGHTSGATAVAVVVVALASFLMVDARRRGLVVRLAVLYALAVGISRVVLGAHLALDVVGGWLLGLTVSLFTLFAVDVRAAVEPPASVSTS